MSELRLSLLGSPSIACNGAPLDLHRHKNVALPAYLAVGGANPGRGRHTREAAVGAGAQAGRRRSVRRARDPLRPALGGPGPVTRAGAAGPDAGLRPGGAARRRPAPVRGLRARPGGGAGPPARPGDDSSVRTDSGRAPAARTCSGPACSRGRRRGGRGDRSSRLCQLAQQLAGANHALCRARGGACGGPVPAARSGLPVADPGRSRRAPARHAWRCRRRRTWSPRGQMGPSDRASGSSPWPRYNPRRASCPPSPRR
jgi:hypothetical protein